MMWPLLVASVMAAGAAIERFIVLRAALMGAVPLIEKASESVRAGNVREAIAICAKSDSPVARTMTAGFKAWEREASCERAMEEQAMIERSELARHLVILDTVTTVAPLLGLLGTVTGMIRAFQVVGDKNQIASPMAITGGVAEALIATATGLGIAIVSLVLFNYLNERVRQVVELMEIAGTRVANLHAEGREEDTQSAPRAVPA